MTAGAREQTASCDAFVLSRRLPAPDAPPSRTSPLCLIAKALPPCACCRRSPVRGTSAGAWNIAVRTRGVFTHRDDFLMPACAERVLVRTATGAGQAAVPRFQSATSRKTSLLYRRLRQEYRQPVGSVVEESVLEVRKTVDRIELELLVGDPAVVGGVL